MADNKERFTIAETTCAAGAVAGYFATPLDEIVRGVSMTIPTSIDLADNFIDAVSGPSSYIKDSIKTEIPEKNIEEQISEDQSNNTNNQLTIEQKVDQMEAYTPSRSTRLKQTLDDAQIRLNPYGISEIVDKPVDLRSKIMEKSKGYLGRLFGNKKMEEDSKAQNDPNYTENYNTKEDIESAAISDIKKSNEKLKDETNIAVREEIVERKKEVNDLLKQAQTLSTEDIYEGENNQQYTSVLDRADELNLAIPNYEIYGTSGVIAGALIAMYIGGRIGKTFDKTLNTLTYLGKAGVKGITIPYNLLSRTIKTFKNRKNLADIGDSPTIKSEGIESKLTDNSLHFQFIEGIEVK